MALPLILGGLGALGSFLGGRKRAREERRAASQTARNTEDARLARAGGVFSVLDQYGLGAGLTPAARGAILARREGAVVDPGAGMGFSALGSGLSAIGSQIAQGRALEQGQEGMGGGEAIPESPYFQQGTSPYDTGFRPPTPNPEYQRFRTYREGR